MLFIIILIILHYFQYTEKVDFNNQNCDLFEVNRYFDLLIKILYKYTRYCISGF